MRASYFLSLAIIGLVYMPSQVQAATLTAVIPRADLFGNPDRIFSNVSPDRKYFSWLAPEKGVMNLWVAPLSNVNAGMPVTTDNSRGIQSYSWAPDGRYLLYLNDHNGNGATHVDAVDVIAQTTRDLTPFDNVRATIAATSAKMPDDVLQAVLAARQATSTQQSVH